MLVLSIPTAVIPKPLVANIKTTMQQADNFSGLKKYFDNTVIFLSVIDFVIDFTRVDLNDYADNPLIQ